MNRRLCQALLQSLQRGTRGLNTSTAHAKKGAPQLGPGWGANSGWHMFAEVPEQPRWPAARYKLPTRLQSVLSMQGQAMCRLQRRGGRPPRRRNAT